MTAESAEQVIKRLRMRPIPEEGAWIVEGPRTQGLSASTVLLTNRPDWSTATGSRRRGPRGWSGSGGRRPSDGP